MFGLTVESHLNGIKNINSRLGGVVDVVEGVKVCKVGRGKCWGGVNAMSEV